MGGFTQKAPRKMPKTSRRLPEAAGSLQKAPESSQRPLQAPRCCEKFQKGPERSQRLPENCKSSTEGPKSTRRNPERFPEGTQRVPRRLQAAIGKLKATPKRLRVRIWHRPQSNEHLSLLKTPPFWALKIFDFSMICLIFFFWRL